MAIKILIAENNIAVARNLQERLEKFGYAVVGISISSEETLEGVKTLTPDLIIMNMRLRKGTDGIKTGALVRSKHDTPIIYMTEFAGQATLRQAKSTGPFGYIFIPFSDRQIYTTLEIALLRNQYEKEIQRQAKRAQTLVKSAEKLNSDLDIKNVLNTICKLTNEAVKASGTGVFLLDNKKDIYYIVSTTSGLEQLQTYRDNKFEFQANIIDGFISKQNPVVVVNDIQDIKDIPYLQLFQKEKIQSMAIAGIYHNQELMGILASIFVPSPNPLQNADLELLKGLSDQAAISITNANLFRQIHIGREHERKLAKNIVDVQEEERRHIARELHDHLGQILTGLQFMLESAKNQKGDAQKAIMEEAQKTVGDMIKQVRELSLNLRPGMLDDMGLVPTIQWHIERFESQTGIHVNFEGGKLNERLPSEVETTAYRIIQEALTNAARLRTSKRSFCRSCNSG